MMYAIEKINNSTLLPGIKLGYEIYDTCADVSKAIVGAMRYMAENSSFDEMTAECRNSSDKSVLKAVVGDTYSETSIAVSRLLSLSLIPQISHASSAATLSDKRRFPSFLRTVPSDVYQTKALAKLIRVFQWNWVGMIASDDDYGRSALQSASDDIEAESICIAFKEMIHSDLGHPQMADSIHAIIGRLLNSSAKVVVVIAKNTVVLPLFSEFIKHGIKRTWIASDAWSGSREVTSLPGVTKVGTVLGFSFKKGMIDGFDQYVENMNPRPDVFNTFIEEYKEARFGCSEEYLRYKQCMQTQTSPQACNASDAVKLKSTLACTVDNVLFTNDDFLVQHIEPGTAYGAYLAVTAIAHGLQSLLCVSGKCISSNFDYPSGQLLSKIRQVNFSQVDGPFYFEENGDSINGYDLMNWQLVKGSVQLTIVGEYSLLKKNVEFRGSPILWNTENNKIPISNCSAPCRPGQYKQHSIPSCCYICTLCPEGYYSNGSDLNECSKCPEDKWSNNGSSNCENKSIEFLRWNNPFSIVLICIAAFGFLTVLVIQGIFLKHRDTPAVKAAGGAYSVVMSFSLLTSFLSTGFFIGEPTDITCQIRQTMYGISFTLCVSCVLVKSLRIVLAFKLSKMDQPSRKITYQPAVVIIVATTIQILICAMWLIFKPASRNTISSTLQTTLLQCTEGSYVAFGIMLGYIGLLALLCFVVAFKGRHLPGKYKEARFITFSMLIYLFVWIAFIPIYISTVGMYLPAVQVVAILASNYGIISCHLLPTCYVIFFRKSINNQSCYMHSIRIFHRARRPIFSHSKGACDPKTHSHNVSTTIQPFSQSRNMCVSVIPTMRRRRKSC
ncbi:G-protein coupled receptor family C group 6 member A-like [Lissotriton helveticus]